MSDTWPELQRLFEQALERPPADRLAFLSAECANQPARRERVERLLEAHESLGDFLEEPLAEKSETALEGSRAGAWRIVRPIGAGGMGMVYLAERADGAYDQQAALKVIRPDLQTAAVRQRFLEERQVLARLNHPNIARLIDGGVTQTGQPYLVMEFVPGKPLDRYCDGLDLSANERVRLFAVVCEAVQYLHQHLVIHADLKCGNIFVTEDGAVKLLDFGTARLLEPKAGCEQDPPTNWLPQMTPDFASPEQVCGEKLTTLTDVYSLGMVLYHLLARRGPFALRGLSAAAIRDVVCRQNPPRPSTLADRVRVDADLDCIALQCLRKDPGERYATVAQLGAEIRRWRAGLPIEVRRNDWRYRTARHLGRHRVAVAAGAVVLASLAAGVAGIIRETRRAEDSLTALRELSRTILVDFPEPAGPLNDTRAVVARVGQVVDKLDRLAASLADGSLHQELSAAYRSAGESLARAGELEQAVTAHEASVRYARQAWKSQPWLDSAVVSLTESLLSFGQTLHYRGEHVQALPLFTEGLARARERGLASAPAHWAVNRTVALWNAADILIQRAGFEDARPLLEESRAVAGEWLRQNQRSEKARDLMAESWARLAALARQSEDPAPAELACREAIRLSPSVRIVDVTCGNPRPSPDSATDTRRLEDMIVHHTELAARDPYSYMSRLGLWSSWNRLGGRLLHLGRHQPAADAYQKAIAVMRAERQRAPRDRRAARYLATSHEGAAAAHASLGNRPRAIALLQEADGLRRELMRKDPSNLFQRRESAQTVLRIARLLGGKPAAREWYERALREHEAIAAIHPGFAPALELALDHGILGDWHRSAGDAATARNRYSQAVALLEGLSARFPQHSSKTKAAIDEARRKLQALPR